MKPRILIVEDKPLQAERLVDSLEILGYTNVLGPFASAEEVLEKDHISDIAILDIHLKGDMDGIDLSRSLNLSQNCPIIFLSQLQDDVTLLRVSREQPVVFLNKPFTNGELKIAVENAMRMKGISKEIQDEVEVMNDAVFVKNGRGRIKLKIDDILWIQSGGGDTSAVITKQRHAEKKLPYPVGHSLNTLETKLNFAPQLARCSRFNIVNLSHVDRIVDDLTKKKGKKLLEIGGSEIGVGEMYRKGIMQRLRKL